MLNEVNLLVNKIGIIEPRKVGKNYLLQAGRSILEHYFTLVGVVIMITIFVTVLFMDCVILFSASSCGVFSFMCTTIFGLAFRYALCSNRVVTLVKHLLRLLLRLKSCNLSPRSTTTWRLNSVGTKCASLKELFVFFEASSSSDFQNRQLSCQVRERERDPETC